MCERSYKRIGGLMGFLGSLVNKVKKSVGKVTGKIKGKVGKSIKKRRGKFKKSFKNKTKGRQTLTSAEKDVLVREFEREVEQDVIPDLPDDPIMKENVQAFIHSEVSKEVTQIINPNIISSNIIIGSNFLKKMSQKGKKKLSKWKPKEIKQMEARLKEIFKMKTKDRPLTPADKDVLVKELAQEVEREVIPDLPDDPTLREEVRTEINSEMLKQVNQIINPTMVSSTLH